MAKNKSLFLTLSSSLWCPFRRMSKSSKFYRCSSHFTIIPISAENSISLMKILLPCSNYSKSVSEKMTFYSTRAPSALQRAASETVYKLSLMEWITDENLMRSVSTLVLLTEIEPLNLACLIQKILDINLIGFSSSPSRKSFT